MADDGLRDKIEFLQGLGLDEQSARAYLKAKNYDVAAAANAFMDGEDISKTATAAAWQDDLFAADREGQYQNMHSLTATAPPSRAPSRAGDRGASKTSWRTQEDADLAAAMHASQNDIASSYAHGQETGVVRQDKSEVKFGPATREEYAPYQWALVPTAQAADEVIPDTDIRNRTHMHGEPRLLKHLAKYEYLSNLLTILHAVPLVREAFLLRSSVQADYGSDQDWWRGNGISLPKIVSLDDGRPTDSTNDDLDDFTAELQRIMAVLDSSNRSYVDPRALMQSSIMQAENDASSLTKKPLDAFLRTWLSAAQRKCNPEHDFTRLFTTVFHSYTATQAHDTKVTTLDIPVDLAQGQRADLSELVDEVLWGSDVNDVQHSGAFVKSPAEVLVMRLYRMDSSKGQLDTEIPSELYMDKYLHQNVLATLGLRLEIAKTKSKISKIDRAIQKLSVNKVAAKNGSTTTEQFLHISRDLFRPKGNSTSQVSNDTESRHRQHQHLEMAEKLDRLIARVDSKLLELSNLKDMARRTISDLSKGKFPGAHETPRLHRYTLCGVATKPNVTYLLKPEDEDDDSNGETMLVDKDDEDHTPEGMQWWRMEYEVSPLGYGAKLTKTRMPDYDVLRAVELEHGSALLVYASDAAVNPSLFSTKLPEPLRTFVERDNEHFRVECEQAKAVTITAGPDTRTAKHGPSDDMMVDLSDIPRPSIEPESRRSFDSTRAEGGSDDGHSPPIYGQSEFLDRAAFGLGYDVQSNRIVHLNDTDPPTHDILLDDASPLGLLTRDEPTAQMEMIEKAHQPLVPTNLQDLGDASAGVTYMNRPVNEGSRSPSSGQPHDR